MKKSAFFLILLALGICAPAVAVSCKSFATQVQAQQYFNSKQAGYKKLDRDRDGIACESNRGGSGKAIKSAKAKARKK